MKKPLYVIVEHAGTCEWGTFTAGTVCWRDADFALVDPNEWEPATPEGFHLAHLCDEHAIHGLVESATSNEAHA